MLLRLTLILTLFSWAPAHAQTMKPGRNLAPSPAVAPMDKTRVERRLPEKPVPLVNFPSKAPKKVCENCGKQVNLSLISPDESGVINDVIYKMRTDGGGAIRSEADCVGLQCPTTGLPKCSVSIGKNKFIRPITDLNSTLQPGDILVFVRPDESDDPLSELMNAMTHAAVVAEDPKSGAMSLVESPAHYTKNLRDTVFHVIRLRGDVPPRMSEYSSYKSLIKSDPTFAKSSPTQQWSKLRALTIEAVNRRGHNLNNRSYEYDPELKTDVISGLQNVIRDLDQPTRLPCKTQFYCSELPLTLYSVTGVPMPDIGYKVQFLENIEKSVYPSLVRRFPNLSKKERWTVALDQVLGTDQRRALGINKETSEKLKRSLAVILSAEPRNRPALIQASPSAANFLSFVSPADLLDMVYDPSSAFSYVGTYSGESCNLIRE